MKMRKHGNPEARTNARNSLYLFPRDGVLVSEKYVLAILKKTTKQKQPGNFSISDSFLDQSLNVDIRELKISECRNK